MKRVTPAAFISYVRFEDEHNNGRLSELCRLLSAEVRVQTGDQFDIFQDRKDIGWGENWKRRIDESIDVVTYTTVRFKNSQFALSTRDSVR